MRFEMFPKFVRQIPAELETCIATHYVERNFDATIAARELIESDEGGAAFIQGASGARRHGAEWHDVGQLL